MKLNAGFIYADNPNRGENIFKALGFFYLSVKKFMVKFFTKFCHNVIKQSCVGQQIFFLVTSTTKEIGRHNFKGLGNVISPLSNNVSRLRNFSASFRQKVDFNRQSCLNVTFYHQMDPFLRAKRHKNCQIKNTLYLWYYNFCLLVINRELRCKVIITL